MPLKHITKFCTGTCRARNAPCKNPAAYGMPVCVKHGAHKVVARGADHGRYKDGQHTNTAKAAYKTTIKKLSDLENIGFRLGFMVGQRTRGPKPL
jgi:hypothetical protein